MTDLLKRDAMLLSTESGSGVRGLDFLQKHPVLSLLSPALLLVMAAIRGWISWQGGYVVAGLLLLVLLGVGLAQFRAPRAVHREIYWTPEDKIEVVTRLAEGGDSKAVMDELGIPEVPSRVLEGWCQKYRASGVDGLVATREGRSVSWKTVTTVSLTAFPLAVQTALLLLHQSFYAALGVNPARVGLTYSSVLHQEALWLALSIPSALFISSVMILSLGVGSALYYPLWYDLLSRIRHYNPRVRNRFRSRRLPRHSPLLRKVPTAIVILALIVLMTVALLVGYEQASSVVAREAEAVLDGEMPSAGLFSFPHIAVDQVAVYPIGNNSDLGIRPGEQLVRLGTANGEVVFLDADTDRIIGLPIGSFRTR